MSKRNYIVHIDMDAFFAAIEQRDNPSFRSKPVIVGADPKGGRGRGVVSTCSYEARRFGVHSAMPISEAYHRCPAAIFLPVDIERYVYESEIIHDILYDFTPDIETVSIDEAFLDITKSFHLFGTPYSACGMMKARISQERGLTASVGLAPTKMAAKIASDLRKPDGLVEVDDKNLLDFLWPLEVQRIWGLGSKTQGILNGMGIMTIGDLAKRSAGEIVDVFGKNGFSFWQLANGIDERIVEGAHGSKSISNEITFAEDTPDKELVESAIMALCEKVSGRMRRQGLKARTVTLKIRLDDFRTFTRSATVDKATNFTDLLYKKAKGLYNNFNLKINRVRLLGVRVSNLSSSKIQDDLFADNDRKAEDIHSAIEKIRSRFGDESIYRARSRQY